MLFLGSSDGTLQVVDMRVGNPKKAQICIKAHNRDVNVFDWNKILDFNGETGPYVQYGYVRTNSLLKKGRFSTKIKFDLLNEKEEIELIKLLNEFPDLVLDSGKQYKPSIVAKYLIDVVRSFNHFYEKHQVLVDDKYLKNARLGLIKAVNIVLENGMRLLGLKVVKEM